MALVRELQCISTDTILIDAYDQICCQHVETHPVLPIYDLGDASELDTWVFEHFTELLEKSKNDAALHKKLHSDKIVFFLHLLGLDTNGHSHLPMSEFYLNNIQIVDEGIKKVTEQLSEFYNNDGKTSYVFTADHGMGNRGMFCAHVKVCPGKTFMPETAFILEPSCLQKLILFVLTTPTQTSRCSWRWTPR